MMCSSSCHLMRAAIDRAMALAPGGRLVVDDTALSMHTAEEVKAELESGIRVDA